MEARKLIARITLDGSKFGRHDVPMGRRMFPAGLAIAFLLSVAPWPATTASGEVLPTEYEIKSAFLYNFAKYIQWPTGQTKESFNVCVLGKDPFGNYLDAILKDKDINGLKMSARRISQIDQALDCQILFISASEESRVESELDALAGKSVLTVGETAHFAERGGVIQFFVDESRVRFQINVTAADRAGLTISSQLLKLARIVKESRASGD